VTRASAGNAAEWDGGRDGCQRAVCPEGGLVEGTGVKGDTFEMLQSRRDRWKLTLIGYPVSFGLAVCTPCRRGTDKTSWRHT